MNTHTGKTRALRAAGLRAQVGQAVFGLAVLGLVAGSAVIAKELTARRAAAPLAMLDSAEAFPDPVNTSEPIFDPLNSAIEGDDLPVIDEQPAEEQVDWSRFETDTSTRYFNGRPVRPIRTIWMTVTAYSPDWRSCGDSADGITSSNHRVETNGYRLVAADSRVLPLGSIISIPGYAKDDVVPVLDRGGMIKGNRLDLLFPTHEQARAWGVKKLKVVVWGYADGKTEDWRRVRDGK